MTIVYCIDGAQYYVAYFQALLGQKCLTSLPKNINPKAKQEQIVIIYSFFGRDNQRAAQLFSGPTGHSGFSKSKVFFICISGEPNPVTDFKNTKVVPDLVMDCKDVPNRRWSKSKFLYLPFFVLHFVERNTMNPQSLRRDRLALVKNDPNYKKTRLCAFMYNHNVAHRNALFYNLRKFIIDPQGSPQSSVVGSFGSAGNANSTSTAGTANTVIPLSTIDGLGKCCNTIPNSSDRGTYHQGRLTFYDTAVDKYRPYKFVVCCENELGLAGYITEKIINAYLAGAIPIYRGAPDIAALFNPKSFINGNHLSDQQLAAKVVEINNNETLYYQMLQEPVFVNNELPKWFHFPLYSNTVLEWIRLKGQKGQKGLKGSRGPREPPAGLKSRPKGQLFRTPIAAVGGLMRFVKPTQSKPLKHKRSASQKLLKSLQNHRGPQGPQGPRNLTGRKSVKKNRRTAVKRKRNLFAFGLINK